MPRKKKDEHVEDGASSVFSDPIFNGGEPFERLPPDHPAAAITKPVLIDGETVTRSAIPRDPLKLKMRLYIQIGEMLHTLETGRGDDGPVTLRERIAALSAIGRLQALLIDKSKDDDENAGSAIRKYEGAFKNGPRGRKKIARSSAGDKLLIERDSGGDESDETSDSDEFDLDAAE